MKSSNDRFNDGLDIKSAECNVSTILPDDVDKGTIKEQKSERYKQNTKYRRCLTVWVMHIVPIWLLAVFALLVLCGLNICSLHSAVLSTLLATTTANILGLAYIVLRGMFPQERE